MKQLQLQQPVTADGRTPSRDLIEVLEGYRRALVTAQGEIAALKARLQAAGIP